MIDTDKYEPTHIDTLLHYTRAHSPDGWRELSKSLIELSDDDRLLIECAPTLRAEVKRLREELDEREAYIKRLSEQLSRATKWALGDKNIEHPLE